MSEEPTGSRGLGRRSLLRGGAVLAGAVGASAVAVAAAAPAHAADGDPLLIGEENSGSSTTSLETPGTAPVLSLVNEDGPTLYLTPLADEPVLGLGEFANTAAGPYVGVEVDDGVATTFLATAFDLVLLPQTIAFTPERLIDTRSAAGRASALRTSPGAFDSAGRLRAGAWIDVAVAEDTGTLDFTGAFLNLTAVGPTARGFLSAYDPGPFTGTSTLNFAAGQTIANGAFVATARVLGTFAVRIYASAPTYVLVDATGGVAAYVPSPAASAARRRAAARVTSAARDAVRNR